MIINCPECGHETSNKAPICPNCGVEIAGKTDICPDCHQAYFIQEKTCPNCRHKDYRKNGTKETRKGGTTKKLSILLLFIALICATLLYLNKEKTRSKENNAYEMAIRSEDPRLMENFLSNFPNATQEHVNAINTKIQQVRNIQGEWTKAYQSKSKSDLQDFLAKYPNTPHKAEIKNLIDSIDWVQAESSNTIDSYQQYIAEHPYSGHADVARENIKNIKTKTIQPEERTAIDNLLTTFFRSINSRNENALAETLSSNITSFASITAPSREDVLQWMRNQYKTDNTSILWRLDHKLDIQKREVGDNAYEYTVQLNGTEEVRTSQQPTATNQYHITAIVSPNHKISSLNLNKTTKENP